MSFKSGVSIDNYDLKFLELKKYLISSEGNNGLNSIAIDNNNQIIFVINDNKLFVIQLNALLSFEWNKSVVNEICHQFQHFSIALNFRPHFVSISAKGFGNKLAICGTDGQNPSPFIIFFDLNDIYRNQSKSSPFSRINLINSSGVVSDIVWHSEFLDNQLGCCLTDGSLFIIYIGDSETRTTSILSHLSSGSNCLSLCWSPKGKQLVVGHKNGYFSQYKLINGQQLQEVKKTHLKNNLNEHNVIAIKWIVSSLFVIAITKDVSQSEKDTHILLVSTPSKAEPSFVDFGALCLDNFDVQFFYKINLLHFNNIILCSTSMTSEVTVIGCDSGKDISLPDNWCQWILEDSSRIDLPMDREGNETFLRGIVISKGTQNVYKLSNVESYGGPNCPLLFVLNSSGVLVPYLMIDKSGFIKSSPPPNISKPAITSPQAVPQPKPITSTPIISANRDPRSQSTHLPKAVIPSLENAMTPVHNLQTIQPKAMPSISQAIKTSTPSVSNKQTVNTEVKSIESTAQPIRSLSGDEKTTVVANELYINAIKEQIIEFNKVMNETKKRYSQIVVNIGDKEQQMKLRNDTRLIDEVLKELKENFKNCSKDTTTLQSSLIESFSLLEEAKSIMDRNVDPKYRNLLKQRALDPITTRMTHKIHDLNQYIETQLRELDRKFEQEWNERVETRKVLKTKQSNRIQPNSSFELIYKSVANNQRVIDALRLQLQLLEEWPQSMSKTQLFKKPQELSPEMKIIERLSQSLSQSSLKDIPDQISSDRPLKLRTISEQKKNSLREFFENRTKVPIRRTVDNSSRFISAIEKLKNKQRSVITSNASPSNVTKTQPNVTKQSIETNPKLMIQSMDNRVNITPTKIVTKVVEQKTEPKLVIEKPLKPKESEPKLAIVGGITKIGSQSPSTPFKTSAAKPAEVFQITPKPLDFSLNLSQTTSPQKPTTLSFNLNLTPKSQTFTTVSETVITTKSRVDSTKKTEPEGEGTSPGSKSVSFGNTTIINPIETTADNSFKLDTISELSETTESNATTNSPFTAFKGFGGLAANESNESVFPKFSLNLNAPNTGFSFNSTANSIKSNDSLPKYEDITPPSTPQKTAPQKIQEKEVAVSSVPTENLSTNSKPLSILKTNIAIPTTCEQNENKTPEPSILRSLITGVTKADSTTPSTIVTPISVAPISSSIAPNSTTFSPFNTSQTTAQPTFNNQMSGKPATEAPPQTTEQISSPFSSTPAINQSSPFASNSFSFGNIASNVSSTVPAFGEAKGLAFGFGTNSSPAVPQQSPTTAQSTGGLSFGQQNSNLNNLAFCGLGGQPNPENASKNTFGGGFSNPPLQQNNLSFNTSPQTSPFSNKPSPNPAFGGSFSSGTAGVAQTGFGAFGASPQQQSPQQTQPVFGGSPLFGGTQQPAFGGSPTFGGPPQSAFGSAPTFGGSPTLGGFATQTNTAFNSNNAFSGSAGSGLSFGAIASTAQQQQHQQQQQQQQNTSPFNSGFAFGGNADSFSFTQRRK